MPGRDHTRPLDNAALYDTVEVSDGIGRKVCKESRVAPVAQLDRASASGAEGCAFDPRQAHHVPQHRVTGSGKR